MLSHKYSNLIKLNKSFYFTAPDGTLRSSLRCGARGRLAAFRFAHPDITLIMQDFADAKPNSDELPLAGSHNTDYIQYFSGVFRNLIKLHNIL